MVTVGFGDVVPNSNLERLFSIFSMLFSCGVYGYMLSKIGKIFEQFDEVYESKKKKLYIINNFMQKKQI